MTEIWGKDEDEDDKELKDKNSKHAPHEKRKYSGKYKGSRHSN
jgi:hypothetical protein